MKRIIANKGIAPILLIVLAVLLFTVCMMFVPIKDVVSATAKPTDTRPTTVELSVNPAQVIAGGTFTLRIEIRSMRTDKYWSSANLRLVTLNAEGAKDANTIKYLSYESMTTRYGGDNADLLTSKYNQPTANASEISSSGQFTVGFSPKSNYDTVKADTDMVIEVPLKVSTDIVDAGITSITLGCLPTTTTKVGYGDNDGGNASVTDDAKTNLEMLRVVLNIKTPSSDPDLSEIKIGPSEDLKPITLQDSGMTYTYTGSDLTDFAIQPTSKDGATIKVGLTNPATTEVESGAVQKLTLTPGNNTVYIQTLAEDGVTTKTYTITVKIGYAALSALTVTCTPTTQGVTKNGLVGEGFDKDTFDYEAYVPDSGKSVVAVTATIEAGYNMSNSITVSNATGCRAFGPVTSGSSLSVYQVTDGATITLSVTANDGVTTKSYTIKFLVLSEDTSISSLTAKGVQSSSVYENSEDKATENSVDYFFVLNAEEGDPKATLELALTHEKATAKVESVEYSNDTQYGLGTYNIVVTADAGNTKTFKVTLSGPLVLELALTSNYEFITEVEIEEWGEQMFYRRTYAELGWKHGVDDKELSRIVLGQILPETTIMSFLSNFDESQYGSIRLYDNFGTLIYDRGNPGDGIDESELDDPEMYVVCTSWYIEYGKTETPNEVIYLSVLGDVDCDGMLTGSDGVAINSYLNGRYAMDAMELRLAAYIINEGLISGEDVVEINAILNGISSIVNHMYNSEA